MKKRWILACLLVISFALTGCSGEEDKTADENVTFPKEIVNEKKGIDGGTLHVALATSSAFAGTLNPCFYENNTDSQLLSWFDEGIISFNEDFVADQDGAATYTYDADAKTITLKLENKITWHDGEPLTLDDLLFAYEVICHPDYEGLRYGDSVQNVVGVEEYHAGKVDFISGLRLSEDESELIIQFKEFYPSILVGGFWNYALPRHYLQEIPVKEMAAHEKIRKTPIGFGPFKVSNIIPGETVEFVRNEDYWRGVPKLDKVIVSVVNPELVPAAMEEGRFDIADFSVQQYPDYKEPTNYQYIGEIETVFSYTGFKMGTWDTDHQTNIYNPESKMANINLRKAIGYAVDNQTLSETLYNNLRFLATTVITPRHSSYQNKELEGYGYDSEKAKKLLEEAGYKDIDGDGFREDPSGNQFTITWAAMAGENAEALAQFKMQCWEEVGLRVELYNGRLTESNAFYEAIEGDDPDIDMYDAAWQTGFDPNPSNLWGRDSSANFTRYTSESFDKIISDISSENAWDEEFLSKQYHQWQEVFFEEAPVIPTLWRMKIEAVNNRVKNYSTTSIDVKGSLHEIQLTAEEPYRKDQYEATK